MDFIKEIMAISLFKENQIIWFWFNFTFNKYIEGINNNVH